jgi:hypothetical protein
VLAFGYLSAPAAARNERAGAPPPHEDLGAYQEPGPTARKAKHAADFVNELLKERGVKKRVTVTELRGGVILAPQPDQGEVEPGKRRPSPASSPPPGFMPADIANDSQLPRPDAGPAERAGLVSPADQDAPGMLAGLAVAAIVAAAGVVLEVFDRRRRKT